MQSFYIHSYNMKANSSAQTCNESPYFAIIDINAGYFYKDIE